CQQHSSWPQLTC
nr:immunoglobulin light chain junction region [Macaca mulatta]